MCGPGILGSEQKDFWSERLHDFKQTEHFNRKGKFHKNKMAGSITFGNRSHIRNTVGNRVKQSKIERNYPRFKDSSEDPNYQ